VDSFTQLTAVFAAGGVPAGTYSVRVSRTGVGSALLVDAFQVLPAGEAKLVANLVVPARLGYRAVATIYLEYSNQGTLAMPAPLAGFAHR
jgi:hypothetical protein